jgi:hypothetical protein
MAGKEIIVLNPINIIIPYTGIQKNQAWLKKATASQSQA